MSDISIQVEDLYKQYRLGMVGKRTISHDFNRWWHKVRGLEDPYTKIGEENDRTSKGTSDYVWALQNINFAVKQGEVLGIIGRNGAGKSTLLKLLSKVTSPSKGEIKINGRIASLLEVGTGFHPDLSGRDNIFLNGAILGMTKKEIQKKFDEIVDFAGVERYIDTPVKRYSSGMYVRLAFAVAAHLEPEILIVDEVLAVGDLEFQKKCLGKMKDVSVNSGRTVFFVSHQMNAITRLCERVVVLKNGILQYDGPTEEAIRIYEERDNGSPLMKKWTDSKAPGNQFIKLKEVATVNKDGETFESYDIRKPIGIKLKYEVLKDGIEFTHGLNLFSAQGVHILSSHDLETGKSKRKFNKGVYEAIAWIPGNFLAEGYVTGAVAIMSYDPFLIHLNETDVVSFYVKDTIEGDSARGIYGGNFPGVVRPILEWETIANCN